MDEQEQPDQQQQPELTDLSASPLAALSRAEIDIQIATAKRWPRSLDRFRKQVRTLATLDEETAGSMFYALPREGRTIEGPSIRFAEIVGSAWTNLRYGARIVSIDDQHVTAQGAAFDLENNVAGTLEAKRRIRDKRGRRYSDDMVTVTSQAAMSIALRNAIFRVVPFALVKDIYEEARAASIGKGKTTTQRRQAAADIFSKWGVAPDKMCQLVGKVSLDDLDDDALIRLRGMVTAIRDGETTVDDLLQDAAGRTVVVTPETLTPAAVRAGDVSAEDLPTDPDQPTSQAAMSIRTLTPDQPVAPVSLGAVRKCLDTIRDEAKRRGAEALISDLLKKYLGTLDAGVMAGDPEAPAKLNRVLAAICAVPAKR